METRTRKFSLIFSINIAHDWFDGGNCPYISLEPDERCRRILNRNRLIWKRTNAGIQVIGEQEGKDEPAHYVFLVRLHDPYFFAITKLDLRDFPGQLFSFCNTPKTNRLSVKKYANPGRNEGALLGMIEIILAGASPGKTTREPFLLSFEANKAS